MPEHLKQMLDEKKDQLEKAMKYYNSEMAKVNAQKIAFDAQQKKFKIEIRDFENSKKKQKEQFEKLKEEELNKLKEQKKIVEQRQKNV